MTALALSLAFLGALGFAAFVMWMRSRAAGWDGSAARGDAHLAAMVKLDARLRALESRPVFTPEMAKQLDAFVTARALDALRSRPAKEPQG